MGKEKEEKKKNIKQSLYHLHQESEMEGIDIIINGRGKLIDSNLEIFFKKYIRDDKLN